MKRLLMLCTAILLVPLLTSPASAVTRGGTLDGDDHPFVGLMVALDADGNRLWRCTGSLISSTVMVTAGHCTEAPAASAVAFFVSDMEPDPASYGVPAPGGPYSDEGSVGVRGSVHVHPAYNPAGFFLYEWWGVGGPQDRGYTPRGKPAADLIRRRFGAAPAP